MIDLLNIRALARERENLRILQKEYRRVEKALCDCKGRPAPIGPSFMDVSTRMPGEEAQAEIIAEAKRLMAPIMARDAMASLAMSLNGRKGFNREPASLYVAGERVGDTMIYHARIHIPEINAIVQVMS